MALYLKYRPQDFNSLVGQGFIKETLKKAVANDKTVGAYLFTGPRGTGKTSTARIFAKAINCENNTDGNPCNSCDICKSFSENSLIDIIEIDAASHTGVDNIREIIEKAQFRPTRTKYKIYIIDEVHMLSKGAFNALLKILEEPPKHVKFILATTEIHKVPETILSRCQRYDFRNHTDEDVAERIRFIAKQEGIKIDDASCEYIVKTAEGGLRNAISLFEQLIVADTVSYEHIVETLGIASGDEIENFLEKLLAKDVGVTDDFMSLQKSGKNMKNMFKEILSSLRERIITGLKNNDAMVREIVLMEDIHEALLKTKSSFDESLTLQVGIFKILAGDMRGKSLPVEQESIGNKKEKTVKKMKEVSEEMQKVVHEAEEKSGENLLSEAQDIFSRESPFEDIGGAQTPTQSFDISGLIENTKSSGGKAALIMSLKGSDIHLKDDILGIHTKTKIAHSTISKPENKEYIIAACEKMGITLSSVEVS